MADGFKVLIDSLGNSSVGYLGDTAESVRIAADPTLSSALVTVLLKQDTWANRLESLELLKPVREMFLGELVLDFAFAQADESDDDTELLPDSSREFVYA